MTKETASLALYRKYRGLNFDDIVGQRHITDALKNGIAQGRISHAYLFTGPRGVGKTSVARILAHSINNLTYEHENNHIDIIEIDAASNRRIDEIRDLREKAHIAPISAKYKVYIIDEVHMLTKEAFNALLKTLEEPPRHVVFILATTELHKLPQTIISRTQRHNFKPITEEDAQQHLRYIADKESISIDDAAIDLLVRHGGGSFRDSISLLDQVNSYALDGKIDGETVREMLGLIPDDTIEGLLQAVRTSDPKSIIELLRTSYAHGVQAETLAKQIVAFLRGHKAYLENLTLIEKLIDVPRSIAPDIKLELALIGACSSNTQPLQQGPADNAPDTAAQPEPKPRPQKTATEAQPEKANQKVEPIKQEKPEATNELPEQVKEVNQTSETVITSGISLDGTVWKSILDSVKLQNNALASILRSSTASQVDSLVIITTPFDFYKKKLDDQNNRTLLTEIVRAQVGQQVSLETVLGTVERQDKGMADAPEEPEDVLAEQIINAFGGGERIDI